ncbi:MAG: 50S ribosomal protein L1 [Legionellales bacterium]|nr:50S ribosomal protein L1 [Legionellales bacterium]|tara:strand:+ start:3060 stop:3755 length:696 start_codon:yes stop_codon:yes gene_type:complete
MKKLSKRVSKFNEKIELGKLYSIQDALNLLKEISSVKFDESVEVAINLGVDARKSDQQVRGSSVLPKGTGKTVRVAVFAEGDNAKKAEEAGADSVGFEDLAETMQKGDINYGVVIATPDAMPIVGKLGKSLGPRGLMPNPKDGTVTKDIEQAVKNAKGGQVRYKTDKNGIIHCVIGKVSFDSDSLIENLDTLLKDLVKIKPSGAKGAYLKKLSLSTTMGPGLLVDQGSLSV